jgi:antitoxin ParD1/3/4
MTRQSISFSKPNDEWLKAQINSEGYYSISELVNDLIRQARKQQGQLGCFTSKIPISIRPLQEVASGSTLLKS